MAGGRRDSNCALALHYYLWWWICFELHHATEILFRVYGTQPSALCSLPPSPLALHPSRQNSLCKVLNLSPSSTTMIRIHQRPLQFTFWSNNYTSMKIISIANRSIGVRTRTKAPINRYLWHSYLLIPMQNNNQRTEDWGVVRSALLEQYECLAQRTQRTEQNKFFSTNKIVLDTDQARSLPACLTACPFVSQSFSHSSQQHFWFYTINLISSHLHLHWCTGTLGRQIGKYEGRETERERERD